MGGDDYVITKNSKQTDAHKAAHDLDEQVTALKVSVRRLITAYEEAYTSPRHGDIGKMLNDHLDAIAAARSLL